MWRRIFIIYLFVITARALNSQVEILTKNFFDNLKRDPKLIDDYELNLNSKQFIHRQIDNYIKLMNGNHKLTEGLMNKKKRSLSDSLTSDITGTYLLQSVSPTISVPTSFPSDVEIFEQNSNIFAAALESSDISENANSLVIFQQHNNSFTEIARASVVNGIKLALMNVNNVTLIAVAENDTFRNDLAEKSAIYELKNNNLTRIQTLNLHYANDIVMWKVNDEIFMAVAHFMSNQTENISYEVMSRVYQWTAEEKFVWIQSIPTKGARKITPFSIGPHQFLAVANFQDDKGFTSVYSEIFKYDSHSGKYMSYQLIRTNACTDIKFFSFTKNNQEQDYFLIVANSFERNLQGNINYETNSILYKFVEDYFIPFQTFNLNGVEQWLPLKGANEEFALFAVCKFDGIKIFQYNGWHFVENFDLNEKTLQGKGINSLRGNTFNNNVSIIVANRNNNGQFPNVFKLEFNHTNPLKTFHSKVMTWCKKSMEKVLPKDSDSFFESILGKVQRVDVNEDNATLAENNTVLFEIEQINEKLDSLNLMLDDFHSKIQKPRIIPKNITANTIIFNKNTVFTNLNTPIINNFTTKKILKESLNISEGFELDEMDLDLLETESNDLQPKKINGREVNSLLYRHSDLVFDELKINGNLFAADGMKVKGTVNGINVSDQNLLLSVGDQTVLKPINFEDIQVEKLTAKSLNGQNLSALQLGSKEEPVAVDHIENLTVKNLFVGGYINDVDVRALDKYALKKTGNQLITKTYTFDEIHGENLKVDGLISGKNLDGLIPINTESLVINQDIVFTDTLTANNLKIVNSLNRIKVVEDKLDVLLKDSEEKQIITGKKIFDNMIIYQPVEVRTKIKSEILNKMNPVISIDKEILLEKNLTITGNVQIEQFLSVQDIFSRSESFSVVKLENNGVLLTERAIQPHFHFTQPLNVDEIFVEKINDIEPSSFVVNGGSDTQIINGKKIFEGNLHVTGATGVSVINNVNLGDLENNVMKIDGNQTIFAKHQYKHVLVKNIKTNKIQLENEENFDQFTQLNSDTITFNKNLEVIQMETKNITINGLVNRKSFNKIISDTVQKDSKTPIAGKKTLENLIIEDLTVENGFLLDEIVSVLENGITEMKLDGPIEIHEPIKIENLHFEKDCNGVTKTNFGKIDTDKDGLQLVHGDRVFDKIVVFKKAFIASDKINDISLKNLVENTVKIDEPFEFSSVTFKNNVISKEAVILNGQIENVDFDNVVLSHSDLQQKISDEKTFKSNVTINGSISFNGLINELNITEFCYLMRPSEEPKNITIDGNVYFRKGPKVVNINQVNVNNISENAWFSDQNANLKGYYQFNNVTFNEDIEIGGFVDNISLSLINENYFSKSKEQTIPAVFTFENDIKFENNITTNEMIVDDSVNGVKLDEFIRTVLLDQYDQIFETVLFLETCRINQIDGDFTVNKLDLESDVMRYDKTNMVTGTKTFKNLNINSLKLEKNINIQNVDILNWFKYSALKTSSCNITGTKTFRNVDFSRGIGLTGKLNNLTFDVENVMVKNIPQEITGKKTFISNTIDPVKFKAIKLRGMLNNMSITDLMNNQAYKDKDNTFKANLIFRNNITTNNLIIAEKYQGINMTELIANVTNLGALNDLLESYRNLLEMSYKLHQSLKNQAYYVHKYKIIQKIQKIGNSLVMKCPDGVTRIGIVTPNEENLQLQMYGFTDDEFGFILYDSAINLGSSHVDYLNQELMGRYLYIEEENRGRFLNLASQTSFSIKTNKTRTSTSFQIPYTGENCILFIYHNCIPKIFCEKNENLVLMQELDTYEAYKDARSLTFNENPFLFTINGPVNGSESQINIWQLNKLNNRFELYQSIFVAEAKSLAVVNYNRFHYLAVASGHLEKAKYSGRIEIHRFDNNIQQFLPWQSIELDAPLQIEFSVLPSGELVLYVVTDNPTEPLLVYNYAGIAGFKQIVIGSTLPNIKYINQIMGGADQHFIIAQSHDEINIIQAIFKGERVLED